MPDFHFPEEPDEERLKVETAALDASGKLEASAYISLKGHFAAEAPRESHPVPSNPGSKEDEQDSLQHLSWWSDARGSGWKVTYSKSQMKCLSVGKWGSWRLAFILARLQRDVWAKGGQQAGMQVPKERPKQDEEQPPAKRLRGRPPAAKKEAVLVDNGAPPGSSTADLSPEKELSPVKRHRRLPVDDSTLPDWCRADLEASPHKALQKDLIVAKDKNKKLRIGTSAPQQLQEDDSALDENKSKNKGPPRTKWTPTVAFTVAFYKFPPDPEDPRLTVEGAKVIDGAKLDVKEYLSFRDHFANEAPKEQHPIPAQPGVKEDEQEALENLRWWSDAKGEGWIAKGPSMGTVTKDKWFSAKTVGSWRLAFLMARLQRDIWLSGLHIESAIANS